MSALGRPRMRLLALFAALATGLFAIALRLFWVQGPGSGRYADLAAQQRERRYELAAQRGSIFDRDGAELALSMDMQTIFANPRFVPDPKAAAAALAPVLGVDPATVEERLSRDSGFVYLARKVDLEVADRVRALGIPGIDSVAESKRLYPAGQVAAHVLGFVGMDNEGLAGLEHRHEQVLRGKPGKVLMERDPRGHPIPAGKSYFVPPTPGHDLVLTIDREIQHVAEGALAEAVAAWSAKGGSVVVMQPKTGEILALANLPTFDPNQAGASPNEAWRNRALTDAYEPGSANKVITAAAAIETQTFRPSDVLNVPDNLPLANKVFHDAHPHPPLDITFAQVIQQSSNVGTIKVAQKLGKDVLHEYMLRFGYGSPTGIDFPGESKGILPAPASWSATSLPTIAIGQGVAVTPMQIVSVYAAVANKGVAVKPRLVKATIDADGVRRAPPPSLKRRAVSPEVARQLTEILLGVTESEQGTGKAAAVSGYQVAGKTGTAQKVRSDTPGYSGHVGSFIGFAPAGDPRLVVGVVLDEPSPIWGGVTAAPAFKEVMQFALAHLGIGPGPVLPTPWTKSGGEGAPLPAPVRSGGARNGGPASGMTTD
jgi:cell division protein FtsI (penicillin-binding protein 3)